ncbi:MAG TPA: response regulator transcription factor [Stellaceae bacterium]|nr:response regulator transcription factor [Stellaceae bacterium]
MQGSEPHLLVVDDDARLRELLGRYLRDQGFRITTAVDAAEARAKLAGFTFDLLIVDVMMPGENGYEFTRSLRRESRIPILMLTAMAEPANRVDGLERGADDYVVKPFEPRELVLRIRNILQRLPPAAEGAAELRFGAYRLDRRRGELFRGTEPVRLTAAETALLLVLARRPGEAVSREDLSNAAGLGGTLRGVDVQMTRLRRKLETDPRFPRFLQTVRGTGYVLKPD